MRQFAPKVSYGPFSVAGEQQGGVEASAAAILRLIGSENLSVKQAMVSVPNDFLNICISIISEWLLIYITKI